MYTFSFVSINPLSFAKTYIAFSPTLKCAMVDPSFT